MTYGWNDNCFQGNAFRKCFPLRLGPCGETLIPEADVTSIVCTARNLGTNAIVNSRNAQNVFGVNGGTYADGELQMLFSAADTALIGSALTTPRETHQFQFTATLDDGTIGTWYYSLTCEALPAVQLNNAFDLGYIRQMLRARINEFNPAVLSDDWADTLLQHGAERTNDVLSYFVGDSTIALVAGTGTYDWPTGLIRPLWCARQNKFIVAADQDQQRILANPFLQNPPGPPARYMPWGGSVIFDPVPNAAVVADSPTVTVRGIVTPASFRLNGFAQLMQQHWDIPVWYAAASWWATPNGNNPALAKEAREMFGMGAAAAKEAYLGRSVI